MRWRGKQVKVPSFVSLAREHSYGRAWYVESGDSIDQYARKQGVHPRYVSDVLAILSPRVSVSMNVRLARSYIETGKAPGAMRARLQALAEYETSGLFGGPKVNAFSKALQGDTDAIVVDAWMFNLFGEPSPTPKGYKRVASKVRATATRLGWGGAETQAALWCGARSLVGYTDSYSPLLMAAA